MIFMTIGPRQIAGASRSTMKPRHISSKPWRSSGGWTRVVVLHRRYTDHRLHRLASVARERGGVLSGQVEGEGHRAVGGDDEVVDHAGGNDVAGESGMLDGTEGLLDTLREVVGGGHAGNVAGNSGGGQR